jgi:hypothetical protein
MDAQQLTSFAKPPLAALLCASLLSLSGCINAGTMIGKTLFGDPFQPSLFYQQTGYSLVREEAEVAIVCTTSSDVSQDFDALHLDLQDELTRRLKRREIAVSDVNEVNDAVALMGGAFDPERVSRAVPDARFLFHIAIDRVTIDIPDSTNLRQGKAHGVIRGYEVQTDGPSGTTRAALVFEHPLSVEYPDHPVPIDHYSEKLFLQQFIDQLTHQVAQVFYDVSIYDLHQD